MACLGLGGDHIRVACESRLANNQGMRWLAVVLLCAACSPDLSVPEEVHVRCASNAECPDGRICKLSLNLCVSTAGDDGRAPGIAEVTVAPPTATVGGGFTLQLTTDETLGAIPDVTFGTAERFAVTSQGDDMQHFEFHYDVRGTESPGSQAVNVTLIDVFGNAAQVVATNVTLDFIAPRIQFATWELLGSKRATKPGDDVVLTVNVDTDTTLVSATLFGDAASLMDVTDAFSIQPTETGLELTGQLTIPSDVGDGVLITIGFALADIAGNVTNPLAALSPPLPVDALPPNGTLSLPSTSDAVSETATLTSGGAVSVRFAGDILGPAGEQTPVPNTVTIFFTPGDGNKHVRATFSDAAGNELTTPDSVVAVTVAGGVGSAGSLCTASADCNSGWCACTDPACTAPRRCSPNATTCGVCAYVNSAGVCQGSITAGTADPGSTNSPGCVTPNACASANVCKLAVGQQCSGPADCASGFCECAHSTCSTFVCATADCDFCKVGPTCGSNRTNNTPCGGGNVCRNGACVVPNPGTCSASCGAHTGGIPGSCNSNSITNNCGATYVPSTSGSCDAPPSCAGSLSCTCF